MSVVLEKLCHRAASHSNLESAPHFQPWWCAAGARYLFYKRLDRGTFRLPQALEPEATTVQLSEHTLEALLDGIEVQAPAAPRRGRPPLH